MTKLLEGKLLGSEPLGRAWCLKALHPAAPELELTGVPSPESFPCVLQNFNQSVVVPAPTGTTTNWQCEIFLYAHPVFQGLVVAQDTSGSHYYMRPIINGQLGTGANYAAAASAATTNLKSMAHEYRIAYMGITGYHDAPATANEGTIAIAQYQEVPQMLSAVSNIGYCTLPGEMWSGTFKTFSDLQSMPNSYLGNARDGFYAPLKLSRNAFEWKRGNELRMYLDKNFGQTLIDGNFEADVVTRLPGPAVSNTGNAPYGIPSTWFIGSSFSTQRAVHARCSNDQVHISAANLDFSSSFTLYIRQGIEMRVRPSTTLSSLQRSPPPEDTQATMAYFEIARQLKDAYPADFNDLGKIMKDIGSVAMDVLPTILPQLGPIVNAGRAAFRFFESRNGQKQLNRAKKEAPLNNRTVRKQKEKTVKLAGSSAPTPERKLRIKRPSQVKKP